MRAPRSENLDRGGCHRSAVALTLREVSKYLPTHVATPIADSAKGGAARISLRIDVPSQVALAAMTGFGEPRTSSMLRHVSAGRVLSTVAVKSLKSLTSGTAMLNRSIAPLIVLTLVTACASSSHVLVGTVRPPISPADVQIYSAPPPKFEEIAVLDASSKSVFGTGGQRTIDKVVEQLKVQAAKLGANGMILEGFADSQTASLGTGVGSDSYSRSSAVGVGVGGSFGVFKKTGKARAIYVAPP